MYSANSQQVCNYLKLRTIVKRLNLHYFNCLLRELHCGIKIEEKKKFQVAVKNFCI